jgi:inositol transport system substrate-binding protein
MRKAFTESSHSTSLLILLSLAFAFGCNSKARQAGKPYRIGVSMLSLQSEFVVNVKDAMEKYASNDSVELLIVDAERNADKQVQQVESFIARGVDAIILNPCEVEASSPAVDRARKAGIPVVNVNSETKSAPDAFVGSNDEESAEIAIEHIAKLTGGNGNVLMIEGYIGQAAQLKRTSGAERTLAKHPGLKVLAKQSAEWDRAKAMSLMENWIQVHGDRIDAVFAQNDEMGLGALQALEQAGLKNKVKVVSIDAIRDALGAVKEKRLDATVYQDAQGQGQGAVQAALALIRTGKVERTQVLIPFQLVTSENVDAYMNR